MVVVRRVGATVRTVATAGQRYGKPVVLQVQARQMDADGHAFFAPTNGVWLTEHVPPRYIELHEDTPPTP